MWANRHVIRSFYKGSLFETTNHCIDMHKTFYRGHWFYHSVLCKINFDACIQIMKATIRKYKIILIAIEIEKGGLQKKMDGAINLPTTWKSITRLSKLQTANPLTDIT